MSPPYEPDVTGAFAYLARRSIANSLRVRVRRLRQPRYLVIALALLLYLGGMLAGRPRLGALPVNPANRLQAELIATALATLALAIAWVLPVGAALRFTLADVQFLFTAPITRRQLIGYKIVRLLLGAAGTGVFLTILLGPTRFVPALMFTVRMALVFAILTLSEAGVSLYRKNAEDHGPLRGGRRAGILATTLVLTPLMGWALARVALAATPGEFASAVPIGILLAAANAAWVLRSDAAFEEASADAAVKVQQAMERGARGQPSPRIARATPFRLAPRGPVETALLWKNWMLFGRASRRALVVTAIGVTMMVAVLVGASESVFEGHVLEPLCIFAVSAAVLFGPVWLRTDLRHDLAYLEVIKTWPVRGPSVVRGEVLASALALTAAAAFPIWLAGTLTPELPLVGSATSARLSFAISATSAAFALIVAQLVIQNGIAVAFPAWVRPPHAAGVAGFEAMGQAMVAMYGALFVLVIAVIVPAAGAAAAFFVIGGLLAPSTVFAVLLLAESLVATEAIGRLLERTDLQDVIVD
jgi:ABC-2 type transport system permease protein